MASIVVAFLLFGLLQGINQGFNTVLANLDVDRLYVSAKTNMTDGLPISYGDRIRAVPGVRAVSHWTYFGGYYQNARNAIPAFATDPEPLFKVYKEIKIKPEYIEAMKKTRTGVLVGEPLAKKYGWKIGDRVPIGTSIWTTKQGSSTWMFDVVGTFDSSAYGAGFPSFYINQDYYKENSSFGGNVAHYYLVSIVDPHQATRVSKDIDALFANSSYEIAHADGVGTGADAAEAAGRHQLHRQRHRRRGAVHAAVPHRQHDDAVRQRAHARARRPQDAGFLRRQGADARAHRSARAVRVRRRRSGWRSRRSRSTRGALKQIFGGFQMPMIVMAMGGGVALVLAIVSGLPPAWRARQLNIVDALAGR